MTGTALLRPLAEWSAGLDMRGPDPEIRERLFATLLDWTTALVAGTGHPLSGAYAAALLDRAETGPAHAFGHSALAPVVSAAAFNAALSHLWEVDDAHRSSTSHPGITVVPAVLALAETRELPPHRVAGAIVAGYEAVLRIGSYLGRAHYAVNHTTATAGTFGAALAAAHALGLDAEQTLWALGHAGTQAAGLWQFLDDGATGAKAFHAATAVRNGMTAARLAEAGIPGASRILEGPRGLLRSWNLTPGDPGLLVPGGRAMIHDVTIKGWPVCGQMHSALDCARTLAARVAPRRDIARVTVELPEAALGIAAISNPETVALAKFSTDFCIAAVLDGHPPDFRGLTPALLARPGIRDLADRVELVSQPAFTARFPAERPARVTLYDAAGTMIDTEERSFRKGDPEAPWTVEELTERARDVLALAAWPVAEAPLIAWCRDFADQASGWRADAMFEIAHAPQQEVLHA